MSRFSVFVILLLSVTVEVIECRKTFGGGGIRFPAPSRHSPSHSTHNTGSGRRPIGFDHYNPPHQAASGFHPPSRPSAPIEPPKYNAPVASAPHGPGTVRPIGFDTSGHHSSGSPHLGQPVGPPKQNTPTGQNPPPYNPAGYGSPPAYNPAGYGNPPAYTQGNLGQGGYHNPGGYNPQGGYHPPGGYQPGYHPQGGGGGYTVINNNINNHHYNGYSGGYGGYSPPVYTSHDTGSTALGFFLGYSLAKVTTPSFLGQNSYNNGPRYDHYTVHHYYHNKENVPSEATIQPNAIVACIGDSGSFCPSNTTSLCTNNGAVMCVASATSTVPCSNQQQTNCVKSSIPCKNNSAPECKESNQDKATIAIPCISTAKVYGHLSYVNNSIVVSNATMNSTSPLAVNSTTNLNVSTTTGTTDMVTNSSATDVSITTTESNLVNATATNNSTNIKEESQMFCVTILALPAERKLTQGEKFINHSKGIFSKFAVKVLGIE